jgi:hypothetical protein
MDVYMYLEIIARFCKLCSLTYTIFKALLFAAFNNFLRTGGSPCIANYNSHLSLAVP